MKNMFGNIGEYLKNNLDDNNIAKRPWLCRYEQWHQGYVISTKNDDSNNKGIALIPEGEAGYGLLAKKHAIYIVSVINHYDELVKENKFLRLSSPTRRK